MIVVDSSALIAILDQEPDATRFLRILADADDLFISAVQVHETAVVLHRRHGGQAVHRLWDYLVRYDIRVLAFDEAAARDAIAAYQRYGKGTGHPAQLNLADCAAYALARALDAPLLFKGNDFGHTDIARAV